MSAVTRLALVIPDLRVGGLQSLAVRLALELDRREWRPSVYTFDGEGPLAAALDGAGVSRRLLARRPGVDWAHAGRLARSFRDDGIGLVHCHNITALFHGARAAARAGRLPVLYTEHDRDLPAPWRQRLLHRWLARRVAVAVAVSARLALELQRTEGFAARELVNGVPDPLRVCARPREAARAELGWPPGPALLAVGSLSPVKNHALLLAALPALRARVPAARLYVAGDGELRAALAASAAALPPGAVTWLGERDDVPRLLAACDLFVLSSRSEGLPLSLIEAHGAGRASLATDVGGVGEVLVDGETGRLVPAGDAAALAAAAAELLLDEG
ncbi:MAG TPA: glycosyltransferase, partial [Planctomycetota bacterium]|nr:glycosyltransferase [Planctomycetota bacterium]